MGNRCNGVPLDQPFVNESRAYCEGRAANARGVLKTSNPLAHDPRAEALWDDGWDSWNENPTGGPPGGRDCCADAFGGGYTP